MQYLDPAMNFSVVTVSQGYGNTDTIIALGTGQGTLLLNPAVVGAYNGVWYNSTDYPDIISDPYKEIIRVVAINGDSITILRGQENSGVFYHNTSGKVYQIAFGITAKFRNDIESALESLSSANSSFLSGFIQVTNSSTLTSGTNTTYTFPPFPVSFLEVKIYVDAFPGTTGSGYQLGISYSSANQTIDVIKKSIFGSSVAESYNEYLSGTSGLQVTTIDQNPTASGSGIIEVTLLFSNPSPSSTLTFYAAQYTPVNVTQQFNTNAIMRWYR
jgi:hypothetical protein